MKNYKKLTVRVEAMDIAEKVYLWSKQLPSEELYGLTTQIRRASVSIPANIAEGSASDSDRGLNRYLRISLGSAFELETHLLLVERLYEETGGTEELLDQVKRVQKRLVTFMKKLN